MWPIADGPLWSGQGGLADFYLWPGKVYFAGTQRLQLGKQESWPFTWVWRKESNSMSLKSATILTSLFTAAVLSAILALWFFGTLFFDDPNASYSAFLHLLERPALIVALITTSCLLLAQLLLRSGFRRPAIIATLLPLPTIIGYGLYLGG